MDGFAKMYELYDNPSNVLFEEENFLNYRPGGFHPVTLGDSLKDGRYKICHKLGYGGFSTVWVARDYRLQQWVSLKITRADRINQSRELQGLRALKQYSNVNPGSERIVQLLDDFVHEGPNGCHQCLVFELLGPTVDRMVGEAYHFGERLDTDTIIRVSTQMLEAVAFMHKLGYAHGDLSIRNLAFFNSRLSRLSEEELFEALGPPDPEDLTRLDGEALGQGIPGQLVESTQWAGWPLDDDEDDDYDDDIRIIDLGEAFYQDTVPEKLAQPSGLQAPETIFTGKFDHRQDLWRVGLVIYHLVFGTLPYSWWGINPLVKSIIEVFGELPPEWELKWEQMLSEAIATARDGPGAGKWEPHSDGRLEKQFDKDVHEPKLKGLLPVIRGLTKILPADRISASQALELVRDNCGNVEVQVMETRKKVLGDEHPSTLTSMNNLAFTIKEQDRTREAIKLITECV